MLFRVGLFGCDIFALNKLDLIIEIQPIQSLEAVKHCQFKKSDNVQIQA